MPGGVDLRFATGPLFLIVLPLVLLVVRDLVANRSGAAIALTGLEYLRARKTADAGRSRRLQPALSLAVVVLLGVLWTGPQIESGRPVMAGDMQTQRKELILAIDVSRSMSGPLELPDREARLAAYGKAASDGQLQSRYEVARDTVFRFIDRFPDARIGLILFSTEPFLARWPTIETAQQFREVLDENLSEASQLRRFSSLTNTDAALRLAKDVFASRAHAGGAVIHISDAEDELENMGLAIRSLRADGIRLYTIGVGISATIADKLMQDFSGDPGFRIFRADSEEEMSDAYRLVAELEESPQYSTEENIFVTELRWMLALLLVVFASIVLWVQETGLHHTRLSRPE